MSIENFCDCQNDVIDHYDIISTISRSIRFCIKSANSGFGTFSGVDQVKIYNAINSCLSSLKISKMITSYVIEDVIQLAEGVTITTEKNIGSTSPGQLYCDSDGKVRGIIISSYDKQFCVLRNHPILPNTSKVIVSIYLKNCDDRFLLQIEEA
jgi:hypothetical protein